ncbi:hypothetical protein ABZZ16_05605, partial [Streptomyces sp. NPDC006386]|uniref:hypothetical protein n=1 Tax=Streptomyces sp. NPDC006386 TaxID=3156762 RepID=UPI0033BD75FC
MSALNGISAALDQDLAAMAELSRRIADQMGTAAAEAPEPTRVHGPRVSVTRTSGMVRDASPHTQQAHLADLVRRYTAKTPTSKRIAQRYRRVLADSRAVVVYAATGTRRSAGRSGHSSA